MQEKSDVEAPAATPALAEARETVIALTRQAGKVQQECGLDILPDEFARSVLKWGLMEVWSCHNMLPTVSTLSTALGSWLCQWSSQVGLMEVQLSCEQSMLQGTKALLITACTCCVCALHCILESH